MFESQSQANPQTPGQALIGQPQQADPQQVGNVPLADRLAQVPTGPQQQQPAPPTPQQQDAVKHHALGRAAAFLFGQQQDEDGNPVKQAPGALFRNMLAGALLGGAMAQGPSGGGGFLGGFSRGGNAVLQEQYKRQQDAQTAARQKNQQTLERDKFAEEQAQHKATLEQWNIENLAHAREAGYKDREQLDRENQVDLNVQKWAVENGAYMAPTIPNNGVQGNGTAMMQAVTRNPHAFDPPAGMGRLVLKQYDFNGLKYDTKAGWTEGGKPVDWSKHLTWTIYYSPNNTSDSNPISMKASEWNRLYHVNFPAGTDPDKVFNTRAVAPLISVATQDRRQGREDAAQSFKEKHDALNATINAARANKTRYSGEKKELLSHGYTEDDEEVQKIDDEIADEERREQDAIDEMHPKVRQRVTQQAAPSQPAKPKPASKPNTTAPARPAGATMKVPGDDGKLHWSDGKQDLGVVQ